MFNYLYCDVLGLMDAEILRGYLAGDVGGIEIGPGFLFGAAVLMEVPMLMVPAALLLGGRAGWMAQLAGGTVMTLVQAGTLGLGTTTGYYLFLSVIEIACTATVVTLAWRWRPAPGPAPVAA
jgi:hypothetical protein